MRVGQETLTSDAKRCFLEEITQACALSIHRKNEVRIKCRDINLKADWQYMKSEISGLHSN
jgi:hypothetical protein